MVSSLFALFVGTINSFFIRMQAQKALGKSNKVMGGSIMIGVNLCSDPVVTTDDNYTNNSSILNQSHVIAGSSSMVPLKNQMNLSVSTTGGGALNDHSVTTLNSSLGGSYLNRSSIRPLTQAYKAANADSDVRIIINITCFHHSDKGPFFVTINYLLYLISAICGKELNPVSLFC